LERATGNLGSCLLDQNGKEGGAKKGGEFCKYPNKMQEKKRIPLISSQLRVRRRNSTRGEKTRMEMPKALYTIQEKA